MRILITGASGYIGRHLCKILERDHEIIKNPFDITGPLHNLRGVQPDLVIHLAGRVHIGLKPSKEPINPFFPGYGTFPLADGNDHDLYKVNVYGTTNLLQYCLDEGVKNIIFASSQAVYGTPLDKYVDEFCTCYPIEQYAESKYIAEQILRWARRDTNIYALRFSGVYGRDRNTGLVHRLCTQTAGGIVELDLPYSLPLDVIHIDDVTEAIRCAVDTISSEQGIFEVINITSNLPCSAEIIGEIIASHAGVRFVNKGTKQVPFHFCSDLAAMKLGWQPRNLISRLDAEYRRVQNG